MVSGARGLAEKARGWLASFFDVGTEDRLKVAFLAIAYFLVIGAYTIARELKDSIFMTIVGKAYQPRAKLLVIFVLIPVIFLYSQLVDRMRRHNLLALCSLIFGIGGLCIVYFIGHDTIGFHNTVKGSHRIFGWLVYFFGECYSPFLVSVLWAFTNSITSPEGAKNSYALMVSASKVGGILAAGFAWFLFAKSCGPGALFSDVVSHQVTLGIASLMLLLLPVILYLMTKMVPGSHLHGYEAAYQVDKQQKKESVGLFTGLVLLVRYPYVMGIFSMMFFYEMVNVVVGFLKLGVAESNSGCPAELSSILFKIIFMMHLVGFFISFLGTRTLLKKLGERVCLMIVPLLIGLLLLYLMVYQTPGALVLTVIALKAINYAFSQPVRESLYIPTIKDIRYKSRTWMDAFGGKFAKTSGSAFNSFATSLGEPLAMMAYSFFFAGIVLSWFFSAFLLGKRFEVAVSNNEVIGLEGELQENANKVRK